VIASAATALRSLVVRRIGFSVFSGAPKPRLSLT
jgi:hypothetical protein